ncbi:MAG: hypothetical protein M1831_006574 [Alyxoria varia]|nr:MAG: hypothetical protein M1831_006574 [Alyxoria varia]
MESDLEQARNPSQPSTPRSKPSQHQLIMTSESYESQKLLESARAGCISIRTSLTNAGTVFGTHSSQYAQISRVLALAEKALQEYEDMVRAPARSVSGERTGDGEIEGVDVDMANCHGVKEGGVRGKNVGGKKQTPLEDLLRIFRELGLDGAGMG